MIPIPIINPHIYMALLLLQLKAVLSFLLGTLLFSLFSHNLQKYLKMKQESDTIYHFLGSLIMPILICTLVVLWGYFWFQIKTGKNSKGWRWAPFLSSSITRVTSNSGPVHWRKVEAAGQRTINYIPVSVNVITANNNVESMYLCFPTFDSDVCN